MAATNVSIITASHRQNDGSFEKMIDSVWTSKEAARNELEQIKSNYNGDAKHLENCRARTPIGQIDDLSVEYLEGRFYECKSFYSITTYSLMKRPGGN